MNGSVLPVELVAVVAVGVVVAGVVDVGELAVVAVGVAGVAGVVLAGVVGEVWLWWPESGSTYCWSPADGPDAHAAPGPANATAARTDRQIKNLGSFCTLRVLQEMGLLAFSHLYRDSGRARRIVALREPGPRRPRRPVPDAQTHVLQDLLHRQEIAA